LIVEDDVHRKKSPAQLHFARQINPVHDAAKTDVREDMLTSRPPMSRVASELLRFRTR
jgi:hypothetical protein